MNRRFALTGVVLLVLAMCGAAIAGCTSQPTASTSGSKAAKIDISAIVADWAASKHQVPVTFAAQETTCAGCHDGAAFATQTVDPKALGRAQAGFGPWAVATDCRACHTGYGKAVMASGKTAASGPWAVPTAPGAVSAGLGAVCMSCHHERVKPDPTAKGQVPFSRPAPHPSSQAGLLLGTGGMRQAGFAYGTTKKHADLKDACVTCHMHPDSKGVPSHTFLPSDPKALCGAEGCHANITDFDRKVPTDWDGNGLTEGVEEEMKGLVAQLDTAASAKMKGAKRVSSGGQIYFKTGGSTGTTSTAPIPDEVYQAAFNATLAEEEGSWGVHNPIYEVELLQQSYKALTGNDVPNAVIVTGSK